VPSWRPSSGGIDPASTGGILPVKGGTVVPQEPAPAAYGGKPPPAEPPGAVTETVEQAGTRAASISLSSSSQTATAGMSVSFTAKVSPPGGATPPGSVTFYDGAAALGTVALYSTGPSALAVFANSSHSVGTHSVTAVYSGAAPTHPPPRRRRP
jgi:hypothetical protein